jgi:hypothetical protein
MGSIDTTIEKNCLHCKHQTLLPYFDMHAEGIAPWFAEHRIVYSHNVIRICESCRYGQVESYSHDCFQWDEPWDFISWFVIDKYNLWILEPYIRNCANRYDPHCECRVHQHLRDSFENILLSAHTSRLFEFELEPKPLFSWLMVDQANTGPNFSLLQGGYYLYSGSPVPK